MVRTSLVALTAPALVGAYAPACVPPAPAGAHARAAVLTMGLFDGDKDAFSAGGAGDKPLVAADRVTPFDRWMGLDKALVDAEEGQMDESASYIDPCLLYTSPSPRDS